MHTGDNRYETFIEMLPTPVSRQSLAIAVLIGIIALSLAVMFLGLSHIGAAVAIGTFFVSWTVLTDLLWERGMLAELFGVLTNPVRLREGFGACVKFVGSLFKNVSTWIAGIFSGGGFWQGAFRVIAVVILLVALAELPSAGRTIVMPFEVNSYAAENVAPLANNDADRDALGGLVTDLVVQELHAISEQLGREAAFNPQNPGFQGESDTPSQLYFYDSGQAEQALAESGHIDLPGGVKLPMQLLLWPIQTPMRYFLDTTSYRVRSSRSIPRLV